MKFDSSYFIDCEHASAWLHNRIMMLKIVEIELRTFIRKNTAMSQPALYWVWYTTLISFTNQQTFVSIVTRILTLALLAQAKKPRVNQSNMSQNDVFQEWAIKNMILIVTSEHPYTINCIMQIKISTFTAKNAQQKKSMMIDFFASNYLFLMLHTR